MSKEPNPSILQLQEDLLVLGIDPGPIDGLPGSKTRGAAHTAAQRNGFPDFTGGDIPAVLIDVVHERANSIRTSPLILPPNYLDLSEDSAAGWREGYRPLSEVQGFCLHQTGCPMPEVSEAEVEYYLKHQEFSRERTPALIRWAKQNIAKPKETPKHTSLKTHFGITYRGVILQIHPLGVWGWSAQGASKITFSIELAGLFAGIEGNLKTRPNAPDSWKHQSVTEAQIEACKALIRYLYQYFKRLGYTLKVIWCHRQMTNDRDPDPGSKVVQLIMIPMMAELGLTDGGEGFTKGKGRKIPKAWNPAYSAPY